MEKYFEIEITGDRRGIYGWVKAVASGGLRLRIRRKGGAGAALVSEGDLRRLEELDLQERRDDYAAKTVGLRKALENAGLVVSVPSGEPSWAQPVEIEGPPVSDQIIAERR